VCHKIREKFCIPLVCFYFEAAGSEYVILLHGCVIYSLSRSGMLILGFLFIWKGNA